MPTGSPCRKIGPDRHRVSVDGFDIDVIAQRQGPHERRLEVAGERYRTLTSIQGADVMVEVDGVPHRIARDDGGLVRNLSPAVVVSIPVEPGDEVEAGDVVAVVESMKMETSLTAPFHGRVRRVLVGPNVQVPAQAPLLQIDALDGGAPVVTGIGERVDFAALAGGAQADALEWSILGYDVASIDPGPPREDAHLLSLYADVRALTTPPEPLHAYLRSLDTEAEGLPAAFVTRLQRVLAGYGVTELDRTPALEEACYRIFVAAQRSAVARPAVLAALDRLLAQPDAPDDDLRSALDRLIAATAATDPVLCDLTREVRFQRFDTPLIDAARERTYEEMEPHIAALAAVPDGPDRDDHVAALVACARPLAPMLLRRMGSAGPSLRRALLEVVARRFYRIRTLEGFAEREVGGRVLLCASYRHDGPRRHLATAFAGVDELPAAVAAFAAWAAELPAGDLAVADFYVPDLPDAGPPSDEISASLRTILDSVALPEAVHRIVVGVPSPQAGREMSTLTAYTFRPTAEGVAEDAVLRGLHPMMWHRLHLARLSEFELERLPAVEDVYLFHGTARVESRRTSGCSRSPRCAT